MPDLHDLGEAGSPWASYGLPGIDLPSAVLILVPLALVLACWASSRGVEGEKALGPNQKVATGATSESAPLRGASSSSLGSTEPSDGARGRGDWFGCCGAWPPAAKRAPGARGRRRGALECKFGAPRAELYATAHEPLEEDVGSLLELALPPAEVDRGMVRARLESLRQRAASLPASGWVQPSDPRVLIRFLKARQYDVEKTLDMLRNTLEWRKLHGASEALSAWDKERHEQLDPYWKVFGVLGLDRQGDPVVWDRMGRSDPASLGRLPEVFVISHEVYTQECIMACLAHARRRHRAAGSRGGFSMTIVMDLAGLNIGHLNRSTLTRFGKLCRIGSNHYPEIIKRVIIVQAPWVFPLVWNVVQHFLDKGTREKVVVVSERNTRRAILEHVPAETVPKALGGELSLDGDPWCGSVIPPGGPVPENLIRHLAREPSA